MLRASWKNPEVTMAEVARRVGHSVRACYGKAKRMGLKMCPPGCEYLWRAAARTGYDVRDLVPILRWANKPLVRRWGRARYVKRGDADAAVALWVSTESLKSVADRTGISRWRLQRRLKENEGRRRSATGHIRLTDREARRLVARAQ